MNFDQSENPVQRQQQIISKLQDKLEWSIQYEPHQTTVISEALLHAVKALELLATLERLETERVNSEVEKIKKSFKIDT